MRKLILCLFFSCCTIYASAQPGKTDLYDLIKKLLYDSTGYENVGDWAVEKPGKFPVVWKADKIEMSPDTSINFYRLGTADLAIRGKSFMQSGQPIKWNIMLKGARSGYSSFSIISSASKDLQPRYTIDSIFRPKLFKAKLLKSCDAKDLSGFYYYELKVPKKDLAYIKLSWLSMNGSTAIRIDCFDSWSKYAVKLNCPN
ncbi:MAG: hypothetical protein JWR18_2613 [Segetibacter sp.]|nr:hypothetical protein [Segetibacter sp.]